MENNFKKYVIFWLSGSISQLGSAMTSFALILWAYTRTSSAMAVSVMAFCNYLPYIVVSLFAGGFVDRHSKKAIMLAADTIAALCSLAVCLLCRQNGLQIWHIYAVNAVIGFMNSFQSPAQSIAVGILVPKDRLSQASGMDSFSRNLVTVFSPMLASTLFAFGGLTLVIAIDLGSFVINFLVLLLFIGIPETINRPAQKGNVLFAGCRDGFHFLREHKGIFYIVITMAVINFFSRLTYENILSPMILARSGSNSLSLGAVNAVMGIGGILGGLIVSLNHMKTNPVKMIYFSSALSFLLGDLTMGLGRNTFWWCFAAMAASLPIPFIMAGQQVIMYETIPRQLQGSVFSLRNAIQYSTIPAGILLGGFLADYVFEPFMQSEAALAGALHLLVGTGAGSGMAVMFLCTGILGFASSCFAYCQKEIRKLS